MQYIQFALLKLESTNWGQEGEKGSEEPGREYLHHSWKYCCVDWQVQAQTNKVREVLYLKKYSKHYLCKTDSNTGKVKRTGNTALWHVSATVYYQLVTVSWKRATQYWHLFKNERLFSKNINSWKCFLITNIIKRPAYTDTTFLSPAASGPFYS